MMKSQKKMKIGSPHQCKNQHHLKMTPPPPSHRVCQQALSQPTQWRGSSSGSQVFGYDNVNEARQYVVPFYILTSPHLIIRVSLFLQWCGATQQRVGDVVSLLGRSAPQGYNFYIKSKKLREKKLLDMKTERRVFI